MKYLLRSFPSADSRKDSYQFLAQVLIYCLEDKPAQEKCGKVNWPAQYDLNSVDWAVKLQTNQQVRSL